MAANSRVEAVKKVGKQMKKACPVDIQLSHARTALARALGFANWFALTNSLASLSFREFHTRIVKLSMDPGDPTFSAAVGRFAESSGVDHAVAQALCVEFLLPALEKWQNWRDRSTEVSDLQESIAEDPERPPAQRYKAEMDAESSMPLAALAGHAGVRFIAQGPSVPVVVRKKRHSFQTDYQTPT